MKKLKLAMLAGLAACAGGGPSETPSLPSSYLSEEPNDSFITPSIIVPDGPLYLVEGYIHAGDLDCILCTGANGIPFNESGQERMVNVKIDYAAGWDCDVYVGWQDSTGNGNFLWQAFDAWGTGSLETDVFVPSGAGWLMLAIGQNTLNTPPDSTRYTFTVEVF